MCSASPRSRRYDDRSHYYDGVGEATVYVERESLAARAIGRARCSRRSSTRRAAAGCTS